MPAKSALQPQIPLNWPKDVTYLTESRLSLDYPAALIPLLFNSSPPSPRKFAPRPIHHPNYLQVKRITEASHPARDQYGLFAKKRLAGRTLVIPYLGIIHATFEGQVDEHEESDYDLSLIKVSCPSSDSSGHVSIGVDAGRAGNAARFVNDYRGIKSSPNAEFRSGRGEAGELRMEIWTLTHDIRKGEEILVSYGKGWWGARKCA
ncbi:MAG: hypothetical protein TREMPRED_000616 [Tremellales sp. Tagirdzhanova-0007]|nr:MAG: hypothetical protein TREMPRED_000616 [Tremellales sp. Tagirdzhanova-0007]